MNTLLITVLFLLAPASLGGQRQHYDDAWLDRWYAGYNETYFQNALPRTARVVWADLPTVTYDGKVFFQLGETEFGGAATVIRVDRRGNPARSTSRLTLLHEMCHVENRAEHRYFAAHGADFQACMLRLAKNGAFTEIW